jgi:hypothetical protein
MKKEKPTKRKRKPKSRSKTINKQIKMGEKLKFEFEKLGKGRRHILTPQNITP